MKNSRNFILVCPRCNIPILEGNVLILPADGPDHHLPQIEEEMTPGQIDRYAAGWFRSICSQIEMLEQNCPICHGIDVLE